jgi:hypothetical protein
VGTILYIGGPANGGRYWLASVKPGVPYDRFDSIYFRAGFDSLFNSTPTWFDTKEESIAAAEEQGFTVLQ